MSAPTFNKPIVTPLTYEHALEIVIAMEAGAYDPIQEHRHQMAKAVMAVDVASREQAWVDRGGPELLAACRRMVMLVAGTSAEDESPVAEARAAIAKSEGR